MVLKTKKHSVESMILSNRIVILNWTSNRCSPCRSQKNKIFEIKKETGSPQINVFDVDYREYSKNFKKLGNVALPSLNVFIDGKPLTVVDTKMSPRKRVGFINKKEKVIEKKTTAITGERPRSDLIKIFKHSLERASGEWEDY